MTETGPTNSLTPVAEVFNAAIRDYARVVQGQIVSASTLGEAISSSWLAGAADLLASLDRLKLDMATGRDLAGLQEVVQNFTAQTETQTLALMAEIQRHDKLRQMLASVALMTGEIGTLDLNRVLASPEAAAMPRHIIDAAAEQYVTVEQRLTHFASLGQSGPAEGSDLELF